MPTDVQTKKALAEATAVLRAKDASASASAVTLTSSILEAIQSIDSSQVDPTASIGEISTPQYTDGSAIKKGKLQQIQDLRAQLFGGTDSDGNTNEGVFTTLGV